MQSAQAYSYAVRSGRAAAESTTNAAQLAVRAALNGSGMPGVRSSAGVVCALF
jgi:hypothetical protein